MKIIGNGRKYSVWIKAYVIPFWETRPWGMGLLPSVKSAIDLKSSFIKIH